MYDYIQNNPINWVDPLGLKISLPNNDEDRAAVIQAWKYDIANDPHAASLFQQIGQSDQVYSIQTTSQLEQQGGDAFLHDIGGPGKNVIVWDPHGGFVSGSNCANQKQTPAMGLLHEVGHAYDWDTDAAGYLDRMKPDDSKWQNAEEKYNILNNENPSAAKRGEWIRTDHETGRFRYSAGPTDYPK